jgi:enterochelin esterase-like enzyme
MPRDGRPTRGRKLLATLLVLVAGCGGEQVATPPGVAIEDVTVDSRAVDREQPVKVVAPEGDGRPLLVFLHGRGNDESSYVREPLLAAVERLGSRAPVIAFPDGGEDEYWHDRDDGEWGRYVVDEVIPAVQRQFGTDPDRVAIGGISMGGFGAYDLARLYPGRFCAVGGHSPALWRSAGETAPGAFDDAEDFARHDVVGSAAELGLPVWLDAGDEDPFLPGDEAFVAALEQAGADVTAHTWPGGHDGAYWDRHWLDYLRFYARELARC